MRSPPTNRRWFLLASVLLATSARASDEPSTKATAFVNALAQGRFQDAARGFDAALSAALPPPRLAGTWKQLQTEIGAFRSIGEVRHQGDGPYTVVLVRCRFEKGQLDAKVVYAVDGRIAGLFFVPPAEPPAAWTPPPYADEKGLREVDVTVGKDWPLPGKLLLPAKPSGKVPAIVLVHGSGPHDLDETIGPNKPFKDLALGLAARGVAVLRYEKRTHAHPTRLAALKGFTVDHESVDDAVMAVELLAARPEIDAGRIFVLGHSLGGTVAPRIAARSKKVAGIILLAGSTRPLGDLMVEQLTYLAKLDGAVDEAEAKGIRAAEAFRKAAAAPDLAPDATLDLLGAKLPGSYVRDFRAYDPAKTAATFSGPVLTLQGGRDYQVTAADLDGWKRGMAAKKNASFKVFPPLNHLFIAGDGVCAPAEYERPGHVDRAVIEAITGWLPAK